MQNSPTKSLSQNLLAAETSPYLLQHAENPVHWRPWGEAALAEAKTRDCPILLSIGYAACHWCHVMAHESFEDSDVAGLMNSLYVNVKVDREERPDIDQIYMSALASMGEQGGWPLTMFLTPDGRPFWGGTYFPKQPRYGRPGFMQILQAIHQAWVGKRAEIDQSASALASHVESTLARVQSNVHPGEHPLPQFATALLPMIDLEKGGLRGAPKFPNAPLLSTLWLQWLDAGDPEYRDAVLVSLRKMLAGGIYDHVGGGLARYSTDGDWMIPHFEKMLYDNALLLRLANWAYSETEDKMFRNRIEQTVAWIKREMRTNDGFASSLDADSDGEEGLFYTWRNEQLSDALGAQLQEFGNFFSLGSQPQWEGAPVIYQMEQQIEASLSDQERANAIRSALLAEREGKRTRPGRDDKVLTDWNGLAVQALAEVGRSLGHPEWIDLAANVFRTIAATADVDGRLPHSVRGERRLYPAFSSDYAALINAAVSLYEATNDATYLAQASALLAQLDRWHGDESGFGHYLTASDSTDVLIRARGDIDEAIPSATAQIIMCIARLASATSNSELASRAETIAEHALARIRNQQYGQAGIVNAAAVALNPMKLILADDAEERLVAVANRIPDPRRVDIVYRIGQGDAAPELIDGQRPPIDKSGAFLCMSRTCLPAITDPAELERVLGRSANQDKT